MQICKNLTKTQLKKQSIEKDPEMTQRYNQSLKTLQACYRYVQKLVEK